MEATVRSYGELKTYVEMFRDSDIQVLFILGEPGQSKSTLVNKVVKPDPAPDKTQLIEGGDVSPFELYKRLYASRNQIFILDDCDQFYTDRTMIRLLKCLCQTEPVKRVGWHKHNTFMDANRIPKEFTTRTRVIIIANKTHEISGQVEALKDRGLMIYFKPSVQEVISLGRQFKGDRKIDPAIIRLVQTNEPYIEKLSLRSLINTTILKARGLPNWKDVLEDDLGIKRLKLAKEIEANTSFLSETEKAVEFARRLANIVPSQARKQWYAVKAKLAELELIRNKR